MDRKRYPACWNDIAGFMKRLNGWECENCGRPCRRPGETNAQLLRRLKVASRRGTHDWVADTDKKGKEKWGRFTLAVAHLDHDPPKVHPDNLQPWRTVCHCRYDLTPMAMARKLRLKLEFEGQLKLLV